jgi:hypothetical protein
VSTLQEIKAAISHLNARDQTVLAAELFAMDFKILIAENARL